MTEFIQVMALPFLACLVLTGIHCYLGLHVIERQVLFVDLALAQIAVLGTSFGIFLGHAPEEPFSYWLSLLFTVAGAAIFAASRFRKQHIPQEAVIGIVYVVASAAVFGVLSFTGEGAEHIRESLGGHILLVPKNDVMKMAIIYAIIGFIHYIFRKQFFLISENPQKAFDNHLKVRWWDFLFYVTFGAVVTSSVKIAGVLLVFSYLVIPAVCAMMLCRTLKNRLMIGWAIGVLGSVLGMGVSYRFDLPTGASVVCSFGLILLALGVWRGTMARSIS